MMDDSEKLSIFCNVIRLARELVGDGLRNGYEGGRTFDDVVTELHGATSVYLAMIRIARQEKANA